ncbi:MAG: ABC transporter permease [Geminicoccaceae bacterium]
MRARLSPGMLAMLPVMALILLGFVVPILLVFAYSLMPPRTFSLAGEPTLANYEAAVTDGYLLPLGWSVWLAALTTLICLALAWPTAKALVRFAGRLATLATILIALPIFISESVRLFGTALFMMPGGGILAGSLNALFGLKTGSILYTKTATLLGMVYVHFPFMLFPIVLGLSLVPQDQVEAARDLGAGWLQVLREVELPLAAPGITVGALLTFVLSLGANAEAAILGGQAVTVITKAIEQRFGYAQDWPSGAALTVLVILVTAAVIFPVLRRLDLDRLIRR